MKKRIGSCTTLLVGKKASIDGSTIIARDEDGGNGVNPQRFTVIQPDEQPEVFYTAEGNTEILLPNNPLRYTSTPDVDNSYGVWGGAGINSKNVAMTATETITTNSRVLGADPFVPEGIGEADILTLVLPYIRSAKEGVHRLGKLLETYGTYEPNGVAFSDAENIWYLETIGGHHWAAVRIPDEAYVIAPNRLNIDHFDFASKDTLCSDGLVEFIQINYLNPDHDQFNFRKIFGSSDIKDTLYNNPRAWYIQQNFSSNKSQPADQDLPFICYPDHLLSIEDVKWALSSHYENTPYDPYGDGSEKEKKKYRPIGINRNLETHILQLRNNVAKELAGIHWLAFGPNTFNAVVPFYANVNQTPTSYRDTKSSYDPTMVFWLSKTTALLGDTNYKLYRDQSADFIQNTMAACRNLQLSADQKALQQKDISAYLEQINDQYAAVYMKNANELLGKMVISGSAHMKLRYDLND